MTLKSDLSIDTSKFLPSTISDETHKLNTFVESLSTKGQRWYQVGAEKYRKMWEAGETPLPKPVYLPEAEDATIPSRDADRNIPVRLYRPQTSASSKGIFLHMHGGGFVLGSHRHQDATLKRFADSFQLTAISVGYRLAPENPFPAGLRDCFDAAEYFVDRGEQEYGAKVLFIGLESAGSCLAVATAFQLLRTRPDHQFAGLLFSFGWFDITLTSPSVSLTKRPLVVNDEALRRFGEAYVPGMPVNERKNPLISPIFEDMQALAAGAVRKALPPALFIVGSIDPLVDDTMSMAMKWMMTGSEAIVKVYPGMPHGFTSFPCKEGQEAIAVQIEFTKQKMEMFDG